MFIFHTKKRRANQLLEKANQLEDDDQALKLYHQALALDPENTACYYNIGLIYKYQQNWEKSFEYNLKAYQINPDNEGYCWNLAIAATALRNWRVARQVWHQLGMGIDQGDEEINADFGITPVRLHPTEEGEVVWGRRIDPVRVRIENVPSLASGFHFADVVLHDGAGTGTRQWSGREYMVFNVFELFQASPYHTEQARIQLNKEQDLETLRKIFATSTHYFEDWSNNIRIICKQCSEGTPHTHHDHQATANEWNPERLLGVAIDQDRDAVLQLFDDWQQQTGARWLGFE